MTATTLATAPRRFGLADPTTYRRTVHLLLDLPIGIALFTLATTFVSVAAALAVTVIGLPLLAVTLAGARGLARLERDRARALLGMSTGSPGAAPRGWRRLTDAAAWRAVLYAVVMLPVGIVTGTTALTGWAVALSSLAYPAYAPFLDTSSVDVGSTTLGGPAGWAAVSVAGALLLLAMPAIVRGLAHADGWLVRRLLG